MIREATRRWTEQLIAELANLPGSDFRTRATAVEEEARRFAERREPVITVCGAYDTGKTSLIKRLVADEALPIPEWLTVGAAPETFERNGVIAFGCVLVDTPGLAAHAELHERRAQEAQQLSDCFVLMLTPQLITSERNELLPLLTGRHADPRGWPYPAGALRIVVGRLDEVGADPEVDPDGYRELSADKRAELRRELDAMDIAIGDDDIFLVAADPHGLAEADPQPSRATYEPYRSWDGVDALQSSLAATPSALPALRDAAVVRYLLSEGNATLDRLRAGLGVLREALSGEERGTEQLRLGLSELAALESQARGSLEALVVEVLASVPRTGPAPEVLERLRAGLHQRLEQWADRYDAELAAFGDRFALEIADRWSRPGSVPLRPSASAEYSAEDATGGRFYLEPLKSVVPTLQQEIREESERWLGATLEQAHKEVVSRRASKRAFEASGDRLSEVLDTEQKVKQFAAAERHSERATRALRLDSLLKVLPTLIDVGEAITSEVTVSRQRRQGAAQRQALQEEVQRDSQEVARLWLEGDADAGVRGWVSEVRELQLHLETSREAGIARAEALNKEIARTATAIQTLESVLARAPHPAEGVSRAKGAPTQAANAD